MSEGERRRELGVAFGELGELLTAHEYPATTRELIDDYGDRELDLVADTQQFGEVIALLGSDTYDSVEEVRTAVIGTVPRGAVGRPRYSDRDPPAIGEKREVKPLSF